MQGDNNLTLIPHDAPTTVYDPLGERCTMVAVFGSHCRVRYCTGEEYRFLISEMEHPDGVEGITHCVNYVSMKEVFSILRESNFNKSSDFLS